MIGSIKKSIKTRAGFQLNLAESPSRNFYLDTIAISEKVNKSHEELKSLYDRIEHIAEISRSDISATNCLFYLFLPFLHKISLSIYTYYVKGSKAISVITYPDLLNSAVLLFISYTEKYDPSISKYGYYITTKVEQQLRERTKQFVIKENRKETFEAISDSQAKDHRYKDGDALHTQVMSKMLIDDLYDFIGNIAVRSTTTSAEDLRDEYFFGKSTLLQMAKKHKISGKAIYDMLERFRMLIIEKINNDGNWDYHISKERTKKNGQDFNMIRK
jgi:hypothetical protein